MDEEEVELERPFFARNLKIHFPCPNREVLDALTAVCATMSKPQQVTDANDADFEERNRAVESLTKLVQPAFYRAAELLCARIACRLWGSDPDEVFLPKASSLAFLSSSLVLYTGDLDRHAIAMGRCTDEVRDQIKSTAAFIRTKALPSWRDFKAPMAPDHPANIGRRDLIPILMGLPDEVLVMLPVNPALCNTSFTDDAVLLAWKREVAAASKATPEQDLQEALDLFKDSRLLEAKLKTLPEIVRIEEQVAKFHGELIPNLTRLRTLIDAHDDQTTTCLHPFLDALEDFAIYNAPFRENSDIPDDLLLNPITVRLWLADLLWDYEDSPRHRALMLSLAESPWAFKKLVIPKADMSAWRCVRKLGTFFKVTTPSKALPTLLQLLRDPKSTEAQLFCALGDCCIAQILTDEPNDLTDAFSSCEEKLLSELMDVSTLFRERLLPVVQPSVFEREARIASRIVLPEREVSVAPQVIQTGTSPSVAKQASAAPAVKQPSRIEPPKVLQEPARRTIRLDYVVNPESRSPRSYIVDCDLSCAEKTVASILSERADITEPANSIARAIVHFAFETPVEHYRTWNKERVGFYSFHKLKRGADRIFIRVRGDTVIFHAFARKDWKKAFAA